MSEKIIRNRIIQFDTTALHNEAVRLFAGMSGAGRNWKTPGGLGEMSAEILREISGGIDPKAVCSYFPADRVRKEGKEITIDGVAFRCNAFEQIGKEQIRGAYAWFIFAGEYRLEERPVMDQLLADMWGTAFADAARKYCRLALEKEAHLSDEFGPGFYGMDLRQMKDLAKLADPSLIGIEVRENGILVPLKSCGGLYLEVGEGYAALDKACADCKGAAAGCGFCSIKNRNRKMFRCTGNCSACGRCKGAGIIEGADDRKTEMLVFPEDFVPETDEKGYGIAFDIGTTTVAGMLWDIRRGRQIAAAAETNPQSEYGADVISRLAFAGEKKENLKILHDKITGCLNRITEKLCEISGAGPEEIVRATVCGNTVMSHLFAGFDPKTLARAPFDPAYTGTVFRRAAEAGLKIREDAVVMLIPNIAGHVGGDITAGILAARIEERKGKTLFIDIGTNGEIVFSDNGRMFTCSAAAGPAFEGAAIYQGMRAARGAVEKLQIAGDDVLFRVIGGVPPEGVCGSGLIDAAAEMRRTGIIDRTGRIVSPEEFEEEHPGSLLCERIRDGEGGREFVLVGKENGEDIIITQKDIRELQLAKAAVEAGIRIVTRRTGSAPEQLDRVIIAGAFGNYIDKNSAAAIGLLPGIAPGKIIPAGNAAGAGTLMALASSKEALRIQQIPEKLEHIQLAEEPDFQNIFLNAMEFR